MPVHIDELTSEVRATAEDIQLSEGQIESLTGRVISELQKRDFDIKAVQEMSSVHLHARPTVRVGE